MKVLVTGANGFVGNALIPELIAEGHEVFALTRTPHKNKKTEKVHWLTGNLLEPQALPDLPKIDFTYYLVHGMKGEDARFEYEEASAAVNFINWIRPTGTSIIYLGGLGDPSAKLSPHLRSRHLTGAIFGSSGLPVTEFRASIVLGEGSLSFEMIKAIAERIPFRPELSLLNQLCQPLALQDLLHYLVEALDLKKNGHEIIEIGGPDAVPYGDLIDMYSELAGLKRKRIKIPEVESRVLLKALDYAIPEHSQIGRKLTESLIFPTVVKSDTAAKFFPDIKPLDARVAMDMARSSSKTHYAPLWEKDFLKTLLSDKILTQSGLLSPDLLKNLERVGKLKDILSRKS